MNNRLTHIIGISIKCFIVFGFEHRLLVIIKISFELIWRGIELNRVEQTFCHRFKRSRNKIVTRFNDLRHLTFSITLR
jgi:hypothetical protein